LFERLVAYAAEMMPQRHRELSQCGAGRTVQTATFAGRSIGELQSMAMPLIAAG
jgi:hypothetical protein